MLHWDLLHVSSDLTRTLLSEPQTSSKYSEFAHGLSRFLFSNLCSFWLVPLHGNLLISFNSNDGSIRGSWKGLKRPAEAYKMSSSPRRF